MNAVLEQQIAKLSLQEKIELLDRLNAEIDAEAPAGILGEDDPHLADELNRRLQEAKKHPESWMTLEQFKASFGDR